MRWPQTPPTTSTGVTRLTWDEFLDWWPWQQGEHVSLIGPTGQGKTTLALEILKLRAWVVALATKPRDATLDGLKREGWHKIEAWPPPRQARRVLLWPPFKKPEYERRQAAVMAEALEEIFEKGGWTVFADEVAYLVDELGLDTWLKRYWSQGRSLKLTLVAATQRPAFVPLAMYSQASWLFLWRSNDRRDLDRLAGLGTADAALVRREVQSLPQHEVLVVGTRGGTLVRTRVDL